MHLELFEVLNMNMHWTDVFDATCAVDIEERTQLAIRFSLHVRGLLYFGN
jgi:hypothetical protein